MEKYTVENKGIITLGDKVMVSDPCYGLNTWCQGIVENVLPGKYECKVGFSNEGDWGVRVADIEVRHIDYVDKPLVYNPEGFEVGVDSGQAGIFDYEYYKRYHTDRSEVRHVDDDWYDMVCDLTHSNVKNPDYEEFHWNNTLDTVEAMLEKHQALTEYFRSIKSIEYLPKLDGNTTDGLGFVSSSGYGDGGYTCWTAKNAEGEVVAIRVEYLTEDYDEEDDI